MSLNRQSTRALARQNGHQTHWAWSELELSDGTKINVRAAPPYLMEAAAAAAGASLPKPPHRIVKSQVLGGGSTVVEDTDDPEYKAAYEEAITKRLEVMTNFQYTWGVDVTPPEEDDWLEEIAAAIPNFPSPQTPQERKIAYIKFFVIKNNADLIAISRATSGQMITEKEIEDTAQSFRDPS